MLTTVNINVCLCIPTQNYLNLDASSKLYLLLENTTRRNISNAVKQSNAIFSLQQRLGNLEMNMYKVSEDKGNLQSQNEQLTDLLRRLTEQNQRLTKVNN